MKTMKQLWILALAVVLFNGCKKEFDEPPGFGEDPAGISANITIAELKAMYTGTFLPITSDYIIEGIVVADDKSGNFYKNIVIQDATAGILIKIDAVDLYNEYPVGRRVFVKLKGLVMGDYNKLIELGIGTDNTDPSAPELISIPYYVKDNYILKGKYGLNIDPIDVSINDLNDSYQNMLIRLTDVEFISADADQKFADAINKVSVNRTIKNCSNKQVLVRTSGYANFANTNTPAGNGDLVAIYSVYRTDKQLYIRDLNDVAGMTGDRCDASVSAITIATVRAAFTGSTTTAPTGKVKGVVISDRVNGNINSKNVIIQDATAGIAVRFSANHTFNLGDEIEVVVSGEELSEFQGLLQINNVSNGNATLIGSGTLPTPQTLTINNLKTNFENYESELVKIVSATISGSGSTYNGTKTLTDASGTVDLYTASSATFSGTAFPTGTVDIIGIAGQGGSSANKQVSIRNTSDVSGGSIPTTLLNENFEGTSSGDIALAGWKNIAQAGVQKWKNGFFATESNNYAQFNPFGGTDASNIGWLITPSVTLGTGNILTFRTKYRFLDSGHTPVKAYISTNFNGTDVAAATWTELSATFATVSETWTASGNISLSTYNGQAVFIGFKYTGSGTDTNQDSAAQLDDIKIE